MNTQTNEVGGSDSWEADVADLLSMLSTAQSEMLSLLGEKRELLVNSDTAGLATMQPREDALIAKLTACQERRTELLDRAAEEGLPADSISALTTALPTQQQQSLRVPINEARARARLLQHQSLTNWVLVQRTLIHLSQILEIIATGGRPEPTYGKGEKANRSGSLVDHAA